LNIDHGGFTAAFAAMIATVLMLIRMLAALSRFILSYA